MRNAAGGGKSNRYQISEISRTSRIIKEEDDYEYLFKIIIIGDSNCGKTKILQRYCNDVFIADSQATIGVEFISKIVEIDHNGETKRIRLQMWDTAGCEKYRSMTLNHTRGAVGAIIVYDIGDETTFYNCQYWVDDLRANLEQHAMIALCANKVDIMFS